jgi:hypothetical protein
MLAPIRALGGPGNKQFPGEHRQQMPENLNAFRAQVLGAGLPRIVLRGWNAIVNKPFDRWRLERLPKAAGLVSDHSVKPGRVRHRSAVASERSRASARGLGGGLSVGPSPSRLALVVVTVAIALGGCGDGAGTPDADGRSAPRTQDERLASQRVQEFLSAMEQRDDARACAMMTSGLRRGITENLRSDALPGSCRTRAGHVYSPAKAPGNADATVVKIRVVGSRATATVTAKPTRDVATGPVVESDVWLEKRGSRWLIANF